MIVPLAQATVSSCGAKAAALGVLRRAGLPVPDGFVVPFDAYRRAEGEADAALPDDLFDAVRRGLDEIGDPPVAVRSSAAHEDSATASAAGQYDSVLGVRGVGAVAQAIRACWASLHSARAVAYQDVAGSEPATAVLIQRLVDADVAGVMFTGGPDGSTAIEASWGLGPSVVGGVVTPDAYQVMDGVVSATVGDKRVRLDRRAGGLVRDIVPGSDRVRPCLDDATAVRLARLGDVVAGLSGAPQDIEWAITGETIWLLQSRPITVAPPAALLLTSDPAGAFTGTPASRGSATGVARVVHSPADFGRLRPGDILVCRYTDPAWTPLFRVAAGVVTETGGVLSHAAIVAREYRIPAVLGLPRAMTVLRDGAVITVDGTAGTVTATDPPT
ncbi:pyruvate,water dikinase [Hamadaea flava]|uniref:PEP/pyruvate-binding domain-containing protein n=1 Tax=Hamadaea flava TaxID=1742688 RepID=A0ABV8LSW0_9ACTN|nr:PEP/pyruvate-binding domain-containing protein [Hamadaea flava]MCP2328341.1 pyruvate,water dikinase [Hamadaea flava]